MRIDGIEPVLRLDVPIEQQRLEAPGSEVRMNEKARQRRKADTRNRGRAQGLAIVGEEHAAQADAGLRAGAGEKPLIERTRLDEDEAAVSRQILRPMRRSVFAQIIGRGEDGN